ncbi:MAG: FG-GAP repeat domain-containing protein, partial [Planctomycetota bacterium JB042]
MNRGSIAAPFLLALSGCADAPDDPGSAAGPAPWFVDEARERGLSFTWSSGADGELLMPEIMGGGAALFDMDGDGDLDAYCVQSGAVRSAPADRPPNRLFENAGDGTFSDVTDGSGADDRGLGMGVAAGDVDGDGDVDLYVTNVGANVLLANAGAGRFEDVTSAAGAGDAGWGTSAAFADLDVDGDLDLYVCNYLHWSAEAELVCYNRGGAEDYCDPQSYAAPAADVLYENDGAGRFVDRTADAGVGAPGTGLGVVAGDLDADGLPDLFVANDGRPDFLWRNLGALRFVDEGLERGCAVDGHGAAKAGMGVEAADFDDDGDLDLLVCNLGTETDSYFRNDGGSFVDGTAGIGLARTSRPFTRFGVGAFDLDLDGRLDLYQANGRVQRLSPAFSDDPYAEPNLLFRGAADGRFEEVLPRGGTAEPRARTSRGAAFGDVDGDGAVDVLVVNRDAEAALLVNRTPGRGAVAVLDVRDDTGAPALGAVISARVAARTLRREVRA